MAHTHGHAHIHEGPSLPHPAQPRKWSLLRMSLSGRLGLAAAIATMLWALVLMTARLA